MILLMSPFISYIIHSGLVETDSIPSQHEEEFSPAQGLDSLVASWSFNEGSGTTLFDSTDNGNDGTISGATWTDGIVGGALEFDGEDDEFFYDPMCSRECGAKFNMTPQEVKDELAIYSVYSQLREEGYSVKEDDYTLISMAVRTRGINHNYFELDGETLCLSFDGLERFNKL